MSHTLTNTVDFAQILLHVNRDRFTEVGSWAHLFTGHFAEVNASSRHSPWSWQVSRLNFFMLKYDTVVIFVLSYSLFFTVATVTLSYEWTITFIFPALFVFFSLSHPWLWKIVLTSFLQPCQGKCEVLCCSYSVKSLDQTFSCWFPPPHSSLGLPFSCSWGNHFINSSLQCQYQCH